MEDHRGQLSASADGGLAFELELNQHDLDTGELSQDDVGDEDETRKFVAAWLAAEQKKDHSRAVSMLRGKCHELAR